MSDLREIFLQPECCADEHTGRLWCEDDAPVDCEDENGNEVPWTRYVRADLYDALRAAAGKVTCNRCRGMQMVYDPRCITERSACPDCADLRSLLEEVKP